MIHILKKKMGPSPDLRCVFSLHRQSEIELKNWCFELWSWRRLLRVPWAARRSNQSILKEISPEYSMEGLILKLKLQYFDHLMQRSDSFFCCCCCSAVSDFATPWTVAYQDPQSMGFSRQKYWSGLPFPSPPTLWKRPWCWERLRVGGEGGSRRWDSWIASLTQ